MKKLISLLLVLCTCFALCAAFTSCDDESQKSGGINETQWNAMIAEQNFSNYTLTQSGSITYAGGSQPVQQDVTIRFADDKVAIRMLIDGEPSFEHIYTGIEAEEQKAAYEQIFLALLADYDNFKYDTSKKAYVNPKTVTTTIHMDAGNYPVTAELVMAKGTLTLTEDKKPLKFVCDLTQTTTTLGNSVTARSEITWTFSNYGTTTISETSESLAQ